MPFSKDIYSQNFDALSIDNPPYLMNEILPIFLKSDLVIVPIKAGVPDIMVIRSTVDLIKEAQKTNKRLRAAIVLNMVKPRASITEQANELAERIWVTYYGRNQRSCSLYEYFSDWRIFNRNR